jgi:hypothetical protein
MLNVPLGRRRGRATPAAQNYGQGLGFQAGQIPYLSLVSARLLVEIGDSRGKQIEIEVVNRTI